MLLTLRRAFTQHYPSVFAKRAGSSRAVSVLGADDLQQGTTTPLAKELAATGNWKKKTSETNSWKAELKQRRRGKAKPKGQDKDVDAGPRPKGDKKRVNIVSEKLCDDIIQYLGPSLKRHVGCDLVDINPGAGLWSRKLHDALQPRSHILMEPDDKLYRPFLEPLLSRPNTKLIPQSGILWREVNEMLGHIKNQSPQPRGAEPQRNDTLLVTANLAFHPKKPYGPFNTVTHLVLYQLLNSIQTATLFQNYGLVRMLVWTGWDDHSPYLAKSISLRKNSSLQAEFACEWMAEVAGKEVQMDEARFPRHQWIDRDSRIAALRRMKEAGMVIPEGRKMSATRQAEEHMADATPRAELQPAVVTRPYHAELREMEKRVASGEIQKRTKEWKRTVQLRNQAHVLEQQAKTAVALRDEMDELDRLYVEGAISKDEFETRVEKWNEQVDRMTKNEKIEFRLARDNLHVFRQDPPVLLWDQRPYEPLAVRATEFFPNAECGLLDIQPRAPHPLLRELGPGSSRAGDFFELILRSLSASTMLTMEKSLNRLWPGAAEGVLPHCPSLRDPKKGGRPGKGEAGLTVRVLSREQWIELLEAFMAWPFRPSYEDLIARLVDHESTFEEDDGWTGSSMTPDGVLTQ